MRNILIGLAAAAAIIVGLFVISRIVPPVAAPQQAQQPAGPTPEEIAQAAASVPAGFIGTKDVGLWTITCTEAAKATPPAEIPAGEKEIRLGRCRTQLSVRDRAHPNSVVLVAVVRPVEGTDEVAMILHTPPVSKKGSKILVALAERELIGLPIVGCEKTQCIALAILKGNVYPRLVARPRLVATIPIDATGQRMIVPLSTRGLAQSVEAMKRAG